MNKTVDLTLHCGASKVDEAEVEGVPTPASTRTWSPISHMDLINEIRSVLTSNHLSIVNQMHSLTRGGNRYFGLMQVSNGNNSEDYAWVLGLRNSHDQSFPAGMVVGSDVFVCDNLAFSGEIRFARKHTRYITRDLPSLVQRAIGLLQEKWYDQDRRIAAYKGYEIGDAKVNDLLVRSLDVGAIVTTQLPKVLEEYRNPRHEAFQPRTAWSLFNSYTEVLKSCSLPELPARTTRLHGLLDMEVGLNSQS